MKKTMAVLGIFVMLLTCWGGGVAAGTDNPGTVVKVAAGTSFNAVLKKDGTVWCFGAGPEGQLGDGKLSQCSGPVKVKGLTDIVDIDAEQGAAVALKADGTVWGWGYQYNDMFGNTYPQMNPVPVQVPGLSDVKAIAAGGSFIVALKNDGTVLWIGSDAGSSAVPIRGLRDIIAVSSMGSHAAALKNDGTVWCWGANFAGQLGNGTIKKNDYSMPGAPVQAKNLSGIIAVSAGCNHTLALKNDGTVWSWGSNSDGQIGDGTHNDRLEPAIVKGLPAIRSIFTGIYNSMAVAADGAVWCWGSNSCGQFGNGTTTSVTKPTRIPGLTDVIDAAGEYSQYVVLKKDGAVCVMGANDIGQLGTGDTENRYYPVKVKGLDSLEVNVTIDGISLVSDAEPVLMNGSVMVPFRAIFEALGAEVSWDAEQKQRQEQKTGSLLN